MKTEVNNQALIMLLKTVGGILLTVAIAAIVMRLTGIMTQASFIDNLWWTKGSAIAGLALWETGTIVRKMGQQKLARQDGIVGITLLSLAVLTASVFFISGIGRWVFYLSLGLLFIGIGVANDEKTEKAV